MLVRMAEEILHRYPFQSGCGRIANSAVLRWLTPVDAPDTTARIAGGRAVVPGGDYVGRAMRFFGDLDPKISHVIDQVTQPGDMALDIGANFGLLSVRLGARVGPRGAVHAFEPQPRVQSYLRKTLALNPDLPITLHPIGLGDEEAMLDMEIPRGNAGAGSMAAAPAPGADTISVPVRRLDTYAQEIGLVRADVIKMDVEGFEARVLMGADGLLQAHPARAIVTEENIPYPDGLLAPALRRLEELGYDVYGLPKDMLRVRLIPLSARPDSHNFVALHRTCSPSIRAALGV